MSRRPSQRSIGRPREGLFRDAHSIPSLSIAILPVPYRLLCCSIAISFDSRKRESLEFVLFFFLRSCWLSVPSDSQGKTTGYSRAVCLARIALSLARSLPLQVQRGPGSPLSAWPWVAPSSSLHQGCSILKRDMRTRWHLLFSLVWGFSGPATFETLCDWEKISLSPKELLYPLEEMLKMTNPG